MQQKVSEFDAEPDSFTETEEAHRPMGAKRIQGCIDERNELSHLDMATVHTPRPSLLRDVAELTNLMFDRKNEA